VPTLLRGRGGGGGGQRGGLGLPEVLLSSHLGVTLFVFRFFFGFSVVQEEDMLDLPCCGGTRKRRCWRREMAVKSESVTGWLMQRLVGGKAKTTEF
jgi:hypothetical protein